MLCTICVRKYILLLSTLRGLASTGPPAEPAIDRDKWAHNRGGNMGRQGIRALLILCILGVLAFVVSGPRTSHADDDSSASLIGSWRGTRRTPGSSVVRHNLISFLPGGSVVEAA